MIIIVSLNECLNIFSMIQGIAMSSESWHTIIKSKMMISFLNIFKSNYLRGMLKKMRPRNSSLEKFELIGQLVCSKSIL